MRASIFGVKSNGSGSCCPHSVNLFVSSLLDRIGVERQACEPLIWYVHTLYILNEINKVVK